MIQPIKIVVSKEFLRLSILLTIIYIVLEIYYNYYVSVDYEAMGFVLDLNLFKYAITKLIYIGLLILSYNLYLRSKFLYAIYLLLMFFFFIPNAILFALGNTFYGAFLSNVFFVCVFSLTPYLKFSFPTVSFSQKKKSLIIFLIAFLLLLPVIVVFKFDLNLKTLLLQDIGETRALFSEKMSGYLAYIYNIEVKTIIPIALIFFMVRKKWILVGLLLLALIYLYMISGNRIVYFTTFILVFFYYLGSNYLSKISNFFIITLALLFTAQFMTQYVFHAPLLGAIVGGTFINRLLFIPALLTQWYFEFFDGNPFYFAESHVFNQFVESPYDMPVGFLLTKIYWNEPTVFANNGLVSDGFMNLGYLGVFLFSIVFAILFSLFNSFNLNKGYFGVFFAYVYMMLSVPFLSSFITGGILIFILLCFLILRNKTSDIP